MPDADQGSEQSSAEALEKNYYTDVPARSEPFFLKGGHAVVAVEPHNNARRLQFLRVGLAFVAQYIELRRHDQRGRQVGVRTR